MHARKRSLFFSVPRDLHRSVSALRGNQKETDSHSIRCWTFASFLRLVKVHATRPNKYRKSDGIAVTFGVYAHKMEQLARVQLWNVNFNKKCRSLSRDYIIISSRMLQTQLTLIPKIIERIYKWICALAKRRDCIGRARREVDPFRSNDFPELRANRNEYKGEVDW